MLEINNLSITFNRYGGWISRSELRPIRCLDLQIKKGQIVSVVGESGAGKSLLAHAMLGLLPGNARVSGRMRYLGEELSPTRIKQLRGREIAFIPQSVGFLNPLWRVGGQVARAARLGGKDAQQAACARDQAFTRYRLAGEVKSMFPYQISGGMARRVMTAAATVTDAGLIVADEPTSGMDEKNSRHALAYLRQLADRGRAVLLITHDIEAALSVSDQVTVFLNGVSVETAESSDFDTVDGLRHPYTRQLLNALPQRIFMEAVNGQRVGPGGEKGCAHFGACPLEKETCGRVAPSRKTIRNGWVRCHHA
jgi:peptide/nickel transport system ATP-binding protein